MKRRVVLIDDHELFRAGVRGEIATSVDIVGEAGSVAEAVPLIRELDPDVVLLDVHLPDGGGVSIKTVEAHVSSVLRKLQLSSRHELPAGHNSADLSDRAGRPSSDPRNRARLRDAAHR